MINTPRGNNRNAITKNNRDLLFASRLFCRLYTMKLENNNSDNGNSAMQKLTIVGQTELAGIKIEMVINRFGRKRIARRMTNRKIIIFARKDENLF